MYLVRVLLFHPWLKSYGGGERLVYEYARRSRHDIDIYTWYLDPKRTWFSEDEVRTIFSGNDPIFRSYLARGALAGLLSAAGLPFGNYDLVLISTSGLAELSLLLKKPPAPVVAYVHTILRAAYPADVRWNVAYRFSGIRRILYRIAVQAYNPLEKLAWMRISFASFNSELSRKRALDKGLISPEATKIIYPGVDLDGFWSGEPEDYFLYVGRFSPLKRQHVLIRAFARFLRKHPGYKLYLVGGSEGSAYYQRLVNLVHSLRLESSVRLISNVSDDTLRDLYSHALAFVHIPFMEDFGIVPFEAAASGRFILNVRPAGSYELLKNFPGIMWLDDPFDETVLEQRVFGALEEFVSNVDSYLQSGRKNRSSLRRLDLSWDRFAKEMDTVLSRSV